MPDKPLISCIIPTYNRPDGVVARIEELSKWITTPEIIVVNDGGEPLKLPAYHRPIKYIELKENSGSVCIPRNIGLSYAEGDYICHVDDDVIQYSKKDTTLIMALAVATTGTNLVFGQRRERRNGITTAAPIKRVWEPNEPMGWGVDNGQILYKRSVYEKIPYVFARRACDWELAKVIRSIPNSYFASTAEYVCEYIWHDTNRSLDDSTKHRPIYPSKFKWYFNNTEINLPDMI